MIKINADELNKFSVEVIKLSNEVEEDVKQLCEEIFSFTNKAEEFIENLNFILENLSIDEISRLKINLMF